MKRRDWCLLLILLVTVIGLCRVTFPAPPAELVLDETDEPGKRCPVHGTALEEGIIPLTFGYPTWFYDEKLRPVRDKEIEARTSLFPFARSTRSGGCGVSPEYPNVARVSYCPDCRRAEAAWKATHEHCIP